jgi:hypothetical protein
MSWRSDHPIAGPRNSYENAFDYSGSLSWVQAGIPIRPIQNWMGHKTLETTMIYLGDTDSEKLRSNINGRSFIEHRCSSFHNLALFIDVDLADDAKRDIQAIPRVAQFSVPGQGSLRDKVR